MTMKTDKPSMVEIRPGHYVWANQAELCSLQESSRLNKLGESRKVFSFLIEKFPFYQLVKGVVLY